jgi:hypothetical protein
VETTMNRERLEITMRSAEKRTLVRWARRMGVSTGALLEYCFEQVQADIRDDLATLESEIRYEQSEITDSEVADLAFERFGRVNVYGLDPA